MAYLQELHPEIFFAIPRPGGIAKIDLPEDEFKVVGKGSKATVKSSRSTRSTRSTRSGGRKSIFDPSYFAALTGYVSREQRIKNALQTCPWAFFEDYQEIAKPPSPMQDTIDILAIVITTVMLLAVGYNDISKSHLRWTFSYLSCIKDETAHIPPNIKGILNHLKMLDGTIDSFIETDTVSSVAEVEEANTESDAVAPAPTEAPPEAAADAPANVAPADDAPADAAPADDAPADDAPAADAPADEAPAAAAPADDAPAA